MAIDVSKPLKVSFVFNAGLHQIPHSLPLALELAAHHSDFDVEVAVASQRHLQFAQALARHYGLDAPVRYVVLNRPWDVRLRARLTGEVAPMKKRTLCSNAVSFSDCDALVTPETTSMVLRRRRLLSPGTRMVFAPHGAGDRAVSVSSEIGKFDFVFVAGQKLEHRLRQQHLIRRGAYAMGVYPKFDWVSRSTSAHPPLFDNDRPTVLYSPHFQRSLSSWSRAGRQVLDYFAASSRYNLVLAPHVRLFEPPNTWKYRRFRRYAALKHMLIDLGSERSIDMSYTLAADAFIGDVSSQVAEFMLRPRPCLFLNPRRVAWRGDPNYLFWTLGPVLDDVGGLDDALRGAFDSHADYLPAQHAYFNSTFANNGTSESSSKRGADALARYLRHSATTAQPLKRQWARYSASTPTRLGIKC